MTVVITSCVDANVDDKRGAVELLPREGNVLFTGTDKLVNVPGTSGEEEIVVDTEFPTTGVAADLEGCGAMHFVQIVETTVFTTVDTVKELLTISLVPDVTVFVTGQVVKVV